MINVLVIISLLITAALAVNIARRGNVFSAAFGALLSILFFLGGPLLWVAIAGELPLSFDFSYSGLSGVTDDDGDFLLYLVTALVFSSVILAKSRFSSRSYDYSYYLDSPANALALRFSSAIYVCSTLCIYIYSMNSESAHWYHSREEFMETTGVLGVLITYLTTGSRLITVVGLSILVAKNGLSSRVMFVIGAFSTYDLIITGNRIGILLLMLGILCVLIHRKNYKTVIAAATIAPFLAVSLSAFAYIRPYLRSTEAATSIVEMSGDNISQSVDGVGSLAKGAMESVNLSTLRSLYYESAEIEPQFGLTYLRPLFIFVPRSMWSEKPESPTVQAGEAYASGRTSLVVTYIGEGMINFGKSGFLIGLPIIIISIFALGRLFSGWAGRGLIQTMLAFLSMRMAFSDVVIWALFAAAIWLSAKYFCKFSGANASYRDLN
ncbi:MAG: hypothetical protein ACJ8GV_07655 [Luteimonas sp.]